MDPDDSFLSENHGAACEFAKNNELIYMTGRGQYGLGEGPVQGMLCRSKDTGKIFGYEMVESMWRFIERDSYKFKQLLKEAAQQKLGVEEYGGGY